VLGVVKYEFVFNMFSSLILGGAVAVSFFASLIVGAPGQLTLDRNFNSVPTKIDLYIYEPKKIAEKPAIIVMVSHI
jgi:hypothetical protein